MLTNCQIDVFRTLEINQRQQFKEHLSKNNDCVTARRVSFGGVISFLISISHLLLLLISAVALKIKSPQWHWKSTVEHNKARALERQNGFGGLTITHFQKPVIIWLVWWLPGISYSQNLSLFDMTGSYPSMNGLFLKAFVENNQCQFFNIMAVWWNELKEDF